MLRIALLMTVVLGSSLALCGQDREKVKVISRATEGEVRTNFNDTLYGEIKVIGAKDYYITSIEFKQKGKDKVIYSAEDIKKFRQVVPHPDRPHLGVDEVYFESRIDAADKIKKNFYPLQEWK